MENFKIENFESIVGKGAKADCLVCDEKHHCIGKLAFILARLCKIFAKF